MRINITPLEEGERKRLILRLRGGDEEAIEPIITSYVPLAHKIAVSYHERYPWLCEEITASAMWGLAYAVTRASQGFLKDEVDIEGYLFPFIKSAVRDFIIKDFPVALTRCELERRRKTGENLPEFLSTNSRTAKLIPFKDFRERFDTVEEMIDEVGYTNQEKVIIELRLDGLTLEAIGYKIELGTTRVYQLLSHIQQKWKDYHDQ